MTWAPIGQLSGGHEDQHEEEDDERDAARQSAEPRHVDAVLGSEGGQQANQQTADERQRQTREVADRRRPECLNDEQGDDGGIKSQAW